jgi:hypothetical protein
MHSTCIKDTTVMSAGRSDDRRGSSFDDLPFDNQLMIYGIVFERMRWERYCARKMDYVYTGHVRADDRKHLWRVVNSLIEFPNLMSGLTFEQQLQDRLRSVVTRLFVPLASTQEAINLTGTTWTSIAFDLQRLIPNDKIVSNVLLQNGSDTVRRVGAVFCSGDGLHTIRLIMMWLPENEACAEMIQIRYLGPQRFGTLENPNLNADHRVEDVGYLMETHQHLQFCAQ